MKLTSNEQQIANVIAKGIVIVLAIFAYLIRLIFKLLYRLKRYLFRLAIVIFIFYNALTVLHMVAYAPYANASEFQYTQKPQTEHEKIVNYIIEVFGKYSDQALKIANCESHLNPLAKNDNTTWGGVGQDLGLFQLNVVYQRVSNPAFLYDYKVNTNMAWVIFKNSGYNWHLWSCKYVLK